MAEIPSVWQGIAEQYQNKIQGILDAGDLQTGAKLSDYSINASNAEDARQALLYVTGNPNLNFNTDYKMKQNDNGSWSIVPQSKSGWGFGALDPVLNFATDVVVPVGTAAIMGAALTPAIAGATGLSTATAGTLANAATTGFFGGSPTLEGLFTGATLGELGAPQQVQDAFDAAKAIESGDYLGLANIAKDYVDLPSTDGMFSAIDFQTPEILKEIDKNLIQPAGEALKQLDQTVFQPAGDALATFDKNVLQPITQPIAEAASTAADALSGTGDIVNSLFADYLAPSGSPQQVASLNAPSQQTDMFTNPFDWEIQKAIMFQ